jgi:hypothetical protein
MSAHQKQVCANNHCYIISDKGLERKEKTAKNSKQNLYKTTKPLGNPAQPVFLKSNLDKNEWVTSCSIDFSWSSVKKDPLGG